ncbi:hypothetical protein MMC32_003682, partial [Xylographa parallela]|nr:hypothetical protein [Xylographa parallela]
EEDVDGEPMAEDEEEEDDVDGEPMDEDGGDEGAGEQGTEAGAAELGAQDAMELGPGGAAPGSVEKTLLPGGGGRRRRPKAEDMFADSEGE